MLSSPEVSKLVETVTQEKAKGEDELLPGATFVSHNEDD